jgi:hypothetical protein
MPYADLSDVECDRRLSRYNDLFTVGLLLNYIRWQLDGGARPSGRVGTG